MANDFSKWNEILFGMSVLNSFGFYLSNMLRFLTRLKFNFEFGPSCFSEFDWTRSLTKQSLVFDFLLQIIIKFNIL